MPTRPLAPISLSIAALVGLSTLVAGCGKLGGGGGAAPEPKTDVDKVFYALGLDIGKNVDVFNMTPAELEQVKAGLTDAITKKKAKVDLDVVRPKIFEMARKRQEAKAVTEKENGKAFVAKAAKESGAEQLPSGVVVKTLRAGTGDSPVATDSVKVNYEGRLTDGTVFDSSYKRNQPAEFGLQGVVKCWTEGLQKVKIGGKAQLTCPSDVAYGEQGRPPQIPGGATLVFDIELLEIKKPEPPKPADATAAMAPDPKAAAAMAAHSAAGIKMPPPAAGAKPAMAPTAKPAAPPAAAPAGH